MTRVMRSVALAFALATGTTSAIAADAPAKPAPPPASKAASDKPAADKAAADKPASPATAGGAAAQNDEGPLAVPDVPNAAEQVAAEVRTTLGDLAADRTVRRIAEALPGVAKDIDARAEVRERASRADPTLAALRQEEAALAPIREKLADFRRDLTERSARVEKEAANLEAVERRWIATREAARASDVPRDILDRINETIALAQRTHAGLDRQQADALSLINRIAVQDGRVTTLANAIDTARKAAVDHLFVRQSLPLWDPAVASRAQGDLVSEGGERIAGGARGAIDYLVSAPAGAALHLAIVIGLAIVLFALKRRVHGWAESVPGLDRCGGVFGSPLAAAFVLSILVSRWIYLDAPRTWWAILGGVALVATVIILRRVADRRLLPILNAVLVFYVIDQLRMALSGIALVPRIVFLAEMLTAALFAWQFARRARLPLAGSAPLSRGIRAGARLALALLAAAFVASVLGYTSLADLLARSVMGGAYVGVIFYAAVLIIDALLLIALHSRPLVLSRMVRAHATRLWEWTRRVVRWGAALLWLWIALDRLTLRERTVELGRDILDAGIKVGSIDVTLGDVLAFAVTLWVAILVSRLVRFVLEEDIFPRIDLPVGMPYAIARTVHYVVMVIGFLAAVAALGVDMTKFTILVGALTVGIGFGLQNIINNFVSGLILLFERPVRVGDVIQMDADVGTVQRIGIRASVIRTAAGADIILPNGKFISDRVTNWTRATRYRPIEIPIAVAADAKPREVMDLITRTAAEREGVVKAPPPEALMTKFGADALGFELRVWTDQADAWTRVKSDVLLAVNEALAAAGIAVR